MNDIIEKGTSGYLLEVCRNSGMLKHLDSSLLLSQFFDLVYNFLFKHYRNEYIYKNAIANKILLGKHSLNTSQMLTELRVGKCKADVVIVNGSSTVYEIKSEYDSFKRLENQIYAYLEIFDHINVITSESQLAKLRIIIPDNIGIMILTDRNTIRTIRESKSNKQNIILETVFNTFRKDEYLHVIQEYYGGIPDVPNTQIFNKCKQLFCTIPVESAHDLTVKILRQRNTSAFIKDFLDKTPFSLKAYALSIGDDQKKMQRLSSRLDKNIGMVLPLAI
ncbi:sce7726 family protein [bacterium]|nr:sce7726 family protein [bacterium]